MNILITGASSGIGKALADLYAGQTCNLFLTARRVELIEKNIAELVNPSANIKIIYNDVSSKKSVAEAYSEVIEACDGIDIAILNAGHGEMLTPETFNSEAAERTFGANTFGIIYWVENILPKMLKKKNGVIVGISSLADRKGLSGSGLYSASKAAASMFLQGLRLDVKNSGIKVITVKPGFVRTEMTDKNNFKMPFLLEPDEAAKIIKAGIEKGKSHINFPLPMVLLMGMINFLPDRVYEFLFTKFAKR